VNLNLKPATPRDSYKTPDFMREALDYEFGFTLDPCPYNPEWNPETDEDGLALNWDGHRVFVNPPWSCILPWVKKAYASKCLTVFLLPNRTDTEWFHLLFNMGAEIRFFKRRVWFEGYGSKKYHPVDGTIVAVVRRMGASSVPFMTSRSETSQALS
jgi:hypothetical protein